jgi:hypothetical protein
MKPGIKRWATIDVSQADGDGRLASPQPSDNLDQVASGLEPEVTAGGNHKKIGD